MKPILGLMTLLIIGLFNGCSESNGSGKSAAEKRRLANVQVTTIANVVNLYTLDMGQSVPENNFDLKILLLSPLEGGGPSGPYIEREEDLIDPWGTPFAIQIPGKVNDSFDIISWGADGFSGGAGFDEDITQ